MKELKWLIVLMMMLSSCTENEFKIQDNIIQVVDSLNLDCNPEVRNLILYNARFFRNESISKDYITNHSYTNSRLNNYEKDMLIESIVQTDTLNEGSRYVVIDGVIVPKEFREDEYKLYGFSSVVEKKDTLCFSMYIGSKSTCMNSGGGYFFLV